MVVNREAPEERFVALEQFLQRVQEQALAEAPRPGEEVVRALVRQPLHVQGLVDVVAVPLADLPEGLDADGELAFFHKYIPTNVLETDVTDSLRATSRRRLRNAETKAGSIYG